MSERAEHRSAVGRARRLSLIRRPSLPRRARAARPLEIDGQPSAIERVYGLGSVYGKTLRDLRRGTLLAGAGIGLIVFVTASQVAAEFGTEAARAAMAQLPLTLPVIFRGMLGEPFDIAKLGGFLSWRTLNFMPVLLGAWSITTLSSLLAAEAARGSLDLIATTPRSRTVIALQKAAAFVTAMVVSCLVIGIVAWVATLAFATLPGDETTIDQGLSHAAWLAVMGLFPGTIAWLLAPVVGRASAAGIAGVGLLASFMAHGYKDAIPALKSLDTVSYFGWTAHHRPLAGVSDPGSVAAVGVGAAILLVAGAVVFHIRDIGVVTPVRLPLPRPRLGLGGPVGRSFAERLPVALGWGAALGGMGLVFALNLDAMRQAFASLPQIQTIVSRIYPGVDIFSAGGILQLVFFGFGALIVTAAAAMLAAGWAADETQGRLEVVLSVPMSRVTWAVRSGVGVMATVVVLTIVVSVLVGAGTLAAGGDPSGPSVGVFVLGLYAAALVASGLAVGGLVRPGLAGAVAGGLGLGFYLLDTIGAGLRLPTAVLDLSLSRHLGQPMAGVFDVGGLIACSVIVVGGVLLSAAGYARRDIAR